MQVTVIVGVALSRPPKEDEFVKVILFQEDDNVIQAELTAIEIASCRPGVVMAVSSKIEKVVS